jgi:transketolase
MSHHATEDLAVMRSLPDVTVFAPADKVEAAAVAKAAAEIEGTCYIRLGRGGESVVRESIEDFQIGKALPVQAGSRVAIFSTGDIYSEVAVANDFLRKSGNVSTIYTFPTVKPIDKEVIRACAESHELIVTCEEHNIVGGLGSAVAEVLAEMDGGARLVRLGITDSYCGIVGDQQHLRRHYGLCGNQIADRILRELA